MAKQTLSNVDVLSAPANLIHWFQSLQNDERANSFGNPVSVFPESFADDGWDVAQGVVKAYKLTPEERKAAVAERQQQYEDWKKSNEEIVLYRTSDRDGATPSTIKTKLSDIAEWAKEHYWTDDKGKWIEPEFGGNCCFRRGDALPASQMAYRQREAGRELFNVPIDIVDYGPPSKDREHRMHLDRLKENSQTGRNKYDPVDQLFNSYKLVRHGYGESDIMKALNEKRGMAQKLHATALLAKKFPDLNILARCAMPKPTDSDGKVIAAPAYEKGGYIPLSRIKAGTARTLLGRATAPDKMDSIAADAMGHRENNRPATQEQVEKAIQLVFETATNADAMLTKEVLSNLRDASSGVVRELLSGIIIGNRAKVADAIDAIAEGKTQVEPAH